MKPRVLVMSTSVDPATDSVVNALGGLDADVTRVDTEAYPYDRRATVTVADAVDFLGWGKEFGSVWYRRVRSPALAAGMEPDVHDYCCQEAKAFIVGSVLASGLPVMSEPQRVWAAEHKLLQLRVARETGLTVPATVVTNAPEDVRAFFRATAGRTVIKPLRSGYAEVGGKPRAVFTSKVEEEHLAHLEGAARCPAIYQALVAKSCDVRVTYVDGELFVAEIDSQSDPAARIDWRRTANPDLPHRPAGLPEALERQIRTFMVHLGLGFGALDFVRTPEGAYVFLEVNPNGQWLWLEDRLGFPISDRIARWLVEHARKS